MDESALLAAARAVVEAATSHIDGRDLLAELHQHGWPHEIDIKTRKDAIDRWYEGDWLKDLYRAMINLRRLMPGDGTPWPITHPDKEPEPTLQ